MLTSPESERDLQRFFDTPDRRFAMANKLPSDCSTVLYAQVYMNTTIVLILAMNYSCFVVTFTSTLSHMDIVYMLANALF